MERIINFIAVAAHVSLMPELASWTRMHMLEHVTISMICISPYAAYKSVSIFISRYFYDTIDLLLPVFLCSFSLHSVLLMRFMWTAFIYRAIMSSSQAAQTVAQPAPDMWA